MGNKWYAVWRGRETGVFDSWPQVQKLVSGYPNPGFKALRTKAEAEALYARMTSKQVDFIPASGLVIYTDGSCDPKSGEYSWAFVAVLDGVKIHEASGWGADPDAATARNVAGELEAAMQAVVWAKKQGATAFTIVHDYSGVGAWARSEWKSKHPFVQRFAAFMAAYPEVRFVHVRGHHGVVHNEEADRLAAQARMERRAARESSKPSPHP